MAHVQPMALGPFQFEALGFGFTGHDHTVETPWAELETAYRKNAAQWTGPQGENFDITGVLFPQAFGGLDNLEGIKSAARNGQPLMLVTRAGRIFGMHRVENIRAGNSIVDRTGLPHKVDYTISLRALDTGHFSALGQLIGLI